MVGYQSKDMDDSLDMNNLLSVVEERVRAKLLSTLPHECSPAPEAPKSPKRAGEFFACDFDGDPAQAPRLITHTSLSTDATRDDINNLCDVALALRLRAVCVPPSYTELAVGRLLSSTIRVCTAVGHPLGATTPQVKAFEAGEAIRLGADEIDLALNAGALMSRDFHIVHEEIREIAKSSPDVPITLSLNATSLDDQQIVIASALAISAGVSFISLSLNDRLDLLSELRHVVGSKVGLIAAAVSTGAQAERLLGAGAHRIKTRDSALIIDHLRQRQLQSGGSATL